MKKIVIVSGSKRNGNTLGIAKIYAEEFQKKGHATNLIDLSSMDIAYCDGCLMCDETQQCIQKDDFGKVIEDIRSADLVVMGTPARWSLLSGELKSFIDRLNPYAAVEGYADINVFIYGLGQSSEEEGASIISAINSVSIFANDAGMNVLGTQAFYNLYTAKDYIGEKDAIAEICAKNVSTLCEEIK